jgi:hypothetical protein
MYHKVKVGDRIITPIDWEMTPELSFGTYESWGGRERVRDNNEQVYYFFIDNWGETPKVCLMERAVKHAKVLAQIDVPTGLIEECVEKQGSAARFEQSYAVDESVKKWLIDNVLDGGEEKYVHPVVEKTVRENMGVPLPRKGTAQWNFDRVQLPSDQVSLMDDDVDQIVQKWNFFDTERNKDGSFVNGLVDPGDGLTVIDERTGLQWQTGGIDICSIRTMNLKVKEHNEKKFGGFDDWRTPSVEEALSLMESSMNFKGLFLNPCFSADQPFIFVAAQRKPGGYWFVDFKQGRAFWSSGTIPGGFGRLCRSV